MKLDQWIYTSFRLGDQGSGYQTYQSSEGITPAEDGELATITKYSGDPQETGERPAFGIYCLRSGRWAVFMASPSKDEEGRGNYFVHALVGRLDDFGTDPFWLYEARLGGQPLFRSRLTREESLGNASKQRLEPVSASKIQVETERVRRIKSTHENCSGACLPIAARVLGGQEPRPLLMLGEAEEVISAFALLWWVCKDESRGKLSCMTLAPSRNPTRFAISGWPQDLGRPTPDYLDRFNGLFSWSATEAGPAEEPLLLDRAKWERLLPHIPLPKPLILSKFRHTDIDQLVKLLEVPEKDPAEILRFLKTIGARSGDINALEEVIEPRMDSERWGFYNWIIFRHFDNKIDGVSDAMVRKFASSIEQLPDLRISFAYYCAHHTSPRDHLDYLKPILEAFSQPLKAQFSEDLAKQLSDFYKDFARSLPIWAGRVLGQLIATSPGDSSRHEFASKKLQSLHDDKGISEKRIEVLEGFIEMAPLSATSPIPIDVACILLSLASGKPKFSDEICRGMDCQVDALINCFEKEVGKVPLPSLCGYDKWANLNALREGARFFSNLEDGYSWEPLIRKYGGKFNGANSRVGLALFRKIVLLITQAGTSDAASVIRSLIAANPSYTKEIGSLVHSEGEVLNLPDGDINRVAENGPAREDLVEPTPATVQETVPPSASPEGAQPSSSANNSPPSANSDRSGTESPANLPRSLSQQPPPRPAGAADHKVRTGAATQIPLMPQSAGSGASGQCGEDERYEVPNSTDRSPWAESTGSHHASAPPHPKKEESRARYSLSSVQLQTLAVAGVVMVLCVTGFLIFSVIRGEKTNQGSEQDKRRDQIAAMDSGTAPTKVPTLKNEVAKVETRSDLAPNPPAPSLEQIRGELEKIPEKAFKASSEEEFKRAFGRYEELLSKYPDEISQWKSIEQQRIFLERLDLLKSTGWKDLSRIINCLAEENPGKHSFDTPEAGLLAFKKGFGELAALTDLDAKLKEKKEKHITPDWREAREEISFPPIPPTLGDKFLGVFNQEIIPLFRRNMPTPDPQKREELRQKTPEAYREVIDGLIEAQEEFQKREYQNLKGVVDSVFYNKPDLKEAEKKIIEKIDEAFPKLTSKKIGEVWALLKNTTLKENKPLKEGGGWREEAEKLNMHDFFEMANSQLGEPDKSLLVKIFADSELWNEECRRQIERGPGIKEAIDRINQDIMEKQSPEIERVQRVLEAWGFLRGGVDGKWGNGTEKAVQKARGKFHKGSGRLDSDLMERIEKEPSYKGEPVKIKN